MSVDRKERRPPNTKLRTYRSTHNWTQEEFAAKIRVSVQTVRRWESGEHYPPTPTKLRICRELNVTPQQLGFEPEEENIALSQSRDAKAPQEMDSPLEQVERPPTKWESAGSELADKAAAQLAFQPLEVESQEVQTLSSQPGHQGQLSRSPLRSRRAVFAGIGAATVALVGAAITRWVLLQHVSSLSSPLPHTSPLVLPLLVYHGHTDAVEAVAWSPDGEHIASGSDDHTVQVWNVIDGSHIYIHRGHTDAVEAVAWSPDGKRIASGSDDHTVQVWDATDGKHIYTYTGHADSVRSVAWSPKGDRVASGSDDGSVQIWNAADGSHIYTYTGHNGNVHAVAWSSNGKWIASGGQDKTVQVWGLSTNGH